MGRFARTAAVLVLASSAAPAAQAPRGVETFDTAWRIVRDTHFDKTMNGVDWDAVGERLRPRAGAARNAGELREVLREMLSTLGQSHFAVIPSTPDVPLPDVSRAADHSGHPGLDVRLVGRDVLVTNVEPGEGAAAAGVRRGWRLLSVGSVGVEEMLRTIADGTNDRLKQVEAWRAVQSRLRGPAGSPVTAVFEDGAGSPVTVTLSRRAEQGQPVTVGSLPTMFVRFHRELLTTAGGATAGLIRFNVWMAAVDAPFQQAIDEFRTADGIILDLRGNPGGLAAMIMGLSGHFIGERKPLGVMKTRDAELRFAVNPRLVSAAGGRVEPFAGPVAILVDAMSGSASECFAGGMQSVGRARVFGQVSMGQALPALFDKLPNGDILIHAYGDFVTADGTRLEGRGVVPDETVPIRREDLLNGRDGTLDAALAWVERSRSHRHAEGR